MKFALVALSFLVAAVIFVFFNKMTVEQGDDVRMQETLNEDLNCYDEAIENAKYLDYYSAAIKELKELKNIESDAILAKMLYQP